MDEYLVAVAEQEELNHLFNDSLSDADLLRAVESIESAQTSVDRALQTGATPNVIRNTSRVGTTGNAGGVGTSTQLHFGKFYTVYPLTIFA